MMIRHFLAMTVVFGLVIEKTRRIQRRERDFSVYNLNSHEDFKLQALHFA